MSRGSGVKTRVGILGGGQLAGMLADAVVRLGGAASVYDPDPEAPARARVADAIQAPFHDLAALREFGSRCDVLTYEREDLPVEILRAACSSTRFVPGLEVLAVAQDRVREKSFLLGAGFPCVRHTVVRPEDSLDAACRAFGTAAIAKTSRGGYDGRGQFSWHPGTDPGADLESERSGTDLEAVQAAFPDATWVVEERLPLAAEASCIVARSPGELMVFPVIENLHVDHVLDRSIVPSRLPRDITRAITDISVACAERLGALGLLAVEFFVADGGSAGLHVGGRQLFVNELAPRPHNSGHVLGRACSMGQFDALARVLTEVPLGQALEAPGAFCMGNLLGEVWQAQQRSGALDLGAWRRFPEVVDLHLYGKRHPAQRRKMGHFVVQTATPDGALSRAEEFRKALSAPSQ
jgi:5-(carboxyamino)imidazole ribonucleotide synthase